jgi:hypothetical protein
VGQEPTIVLIVSAGRSGSKFLRDLLGAAEQCTVVPYDVNFVWRHGNEGVKDDELRPADIDDRERMWIRQRILDVSGWRPGGASSIVVEKTVSNSLRVPFVRAVFPDARIIHLIRDGRAVAESARRVWNERPGSAYALGKLRYMSVRDLGYLSKYFVNQLRFGSEDRSRRSWGPRYRGIDDDLACLSLLEVCAYQWKACVSRATEALSSVHGPTLTLRYEDLVRSPSVLEEVCRFAGVGDASSVKDAWADRNNPRNADKWRASLRPDEQRLLGDLLKPELKQLGYMVDEVC